MDEKEHQVEKIKARRAKSGRVSYGDPVLLHDSSKSRVLFVPFFIRHTDHTELAIRVNTFLKKEPPNDWVLLQDKSISLGETSSRKLLRALQTHLQVAESGEDGSFLVIRISEGTANLATHDPSKVAQALTKVLSQPEIVEHLEQTELSSQLIEALRSAIRLSEMRTAVATLRETLAAGKNDEPTYQAWCEKHSWAFGNAYVVRDEVRNISPGRVAAT